MGVSAPDLGRDPVRPRRTLPLIGGESNGSNGLGFLGTVRAARLYSFVTRRAGRLTRERQRASSRLDRWPAVACVQLLTGLKPLPSGEGLPGELISLSTAENFTYSNDVPLAAMPRT